MVDVRPFKGLRYNSGALGLDLSAVICPPYDVISPKEREALVARDPWNVVRLELPRAQGEGSDPYQAAADQLDVWLRDGALVQDSKAALYAYLVDFAVDGGRVQRRGLVAALRLEDGEPRMVKPHERTLPGPKQDRLNLMRACRANFSPIWCLYRERSGATDAFWSHVATLPPVARAVDADDVEHTLWAVADRGILERLRAAFADVPVYIADGHHRYETALHYRSEARTAGDEEPDASANFAMTYFVESGDPGLVVLGTHRLLHVPADRGDLVSVLRDALADGLDLYVGRAGVRELYRQLAAEDSRPAFGVWCPPVGISLVARPRGDGLVPKDLVDGHSDAWRGLDLAVLHSAFLQPLFPEGAARLVEQGLLRYTRDLDDVEEAVEQDDRTIALLVRPTPVEHIMAVADAEDRMPEKSTYFFPKPVTGLVMASLAGRVPVQE
jgi:uncharacterized protein (DUF1015 family)